jgi:hypothetical protein
MLRYFATNTVNQLFRAHAFPHVAIPHGLPSKTAFTELRGVPAHSEERGASTGKLGVAEATCMMRTGGVGCGQICTTVQSLLIQ